MRRREFITFIGGAVVGWPIAAHAQQPAMPVIGFLSTRMPNESAHLVAAFRRGLAENGYVEGQNVAVEYRWALGQYDRLPALATELVRRPVAVLASVGGDPAAQAAKAATATIPIVFEIGSDPIKLGLVTSYNRPGGNATGINILTSTLEAKRLGLLRELVPRAAAVGLLWNPRFASAESQLRDVQEAARVINMTIRALPASTDREIELAFETVAQERIRALAVAADPFLTMSGDKIVALAARAAVPAMYEFRGQVAAGGLMSYGIDVVDVYRQAGVYVGRILKGEKPADLPVLQPTKFELVINLKTANALGLNVPDRLIALADEVIE